MLPPSISAEPCLNAVLNKTLWQPARRGELYVHGDAVSRHVHCQRHLKLMAAHVSALRAVNIVNEIMRYRTA